MEIYDTTLRDGEQAAGAKFDLAGRLDLCNRLNDFGVDFIELGWPVASDDIMKAFKTVCVSEHAIRKIAAFGSTSLTPDPSNDRNLASIIESGAGIACIFGKSCTNHVARQLKISPEENLDKIEGSVDFLRSQGKRVFYDAEHYFDAFKRNQDYALATLSMAVRGGAERLILCDTNGGSMPNEVAEATKFTREFLNEQKISVGLGLHTHDDRGLAVANALAALPWIVQVQGTINGMGERTGNMNLSTFIPNYFLSGGKLRVDLKSLTRLNELAFRLCGLDLPQSRPFVGSNAFTHKGGVHIDATAKTLTDQHRLYEHIDPDLVGNRRILDLNTLGGRAAVMFVAKQFGYHFDKRDPEFIRRADALQSELSNLEAEGYRIGCNPSEQFLLVSKYFGNVPEFFHVQRFKATTDVNRRQEFSDAFVHVNILGKDVERHVRVKGGPVDALYKSLSKAVASVYPCVADTHLIDFRVGIARDREEASSVRTSLTFRNGGSPYTTVGVDNNILEASIKAIEKGLRYSLIHAHTSSGTPGRT